MPCIHLNTQSMVMMVRKLIILMLSVILSTGLLGLFSFAQERNKPGTTSPLHPSLSILLTQSVIFIYQDKTPQNAAKLVVGRPLGTAFLVGIPMPGWPDRIIPFVVTAKRVVADQPRVLARYTPKSGAVPIYIQYDLDRLRKNGDLWEYPNDEGVDVIVFRTFVYENVNSLFFPLELIASKETFLQQHIGISDRIMIPCLMQDFPGLTQNYPIFRDGSIALVTEEPVPFKLKLGARMIDTKRQLIFVNSVLNEGSSGAPVFLWPGFRLLEGKGTMGGKPWLIGIVSGYSPVLHQVIDADGEDVIIDKPSSGSSDLAGQIKPPRKVAVLSQESSATGALFPSWYLLDILQSDSLKKRVQQITDEVNKTEPSEKKN